MELMHYVAGRSRKQLADICSSSMSGGSCLVQGASRLPNSHLPISALRSSGHVLQNDGDSETTARPAPAISSTTCLQLGSKKRWRSLAEIRTPYPAASVRTDAPLCHPVTLIPASFPW
jgi:hypothetical protein